MLTVRLIKENGEEELFEARKVSLAIPENANTSDEKHLYVQTDEGLVIIGSGQVYVMNSGGKTVGDYLFSMSPQPVYGHKIG